MHLKKKVLQLLSTSGFVINIIFFVWCKLHVQSMMQLLSVCKLICVPQGRPIDPLLFMYLVMTLIMFQIMYADTYIFSCFIPHVSISVTRL